MADSVAERIPVEKVDSCMWAFLSRYLRHTELDKNENRTICHGVRIGSVVCPLSLICSRLFAVRSFVDEKKCPISIVAAYRTLVKIGDWDFFDLTSKFDFCIRCFVPFRGATYITLERQLFSS